MSSVVFDNIPLVFEVDRVHRSKLDMLFNKPQPEPPTKTVLIWGGVEEEQYLYDDPVYLSELLVYYQDIYDRERGLFQSAITFDIGIAMTIVDVELLEVTNNLLVTLLTIKQMTTLFDEVVYNSTVSNKGLDIAVSLLNVREYGELVHKIKTPVSDTTYSPLYRDMLVAKTQMYSWSDFCDLSGQDQSTLVMFNSLESTLEYLSSKRR